MSDHVDRFFAAVSVMAADGHVKQRLIRAYEENLQNIEESELPPPARKAFAELRRKMRCVAPLNGEGAIRATVRKMSIRDAALCGRLMLDLLAVLIRENVHNPGQHRLPLPADQQPVVPPFLVKSG
ncbi:MAG TPA: hypothetical protein VFG91_02350 [Woeseiaceae bacterium]|nr:hypothetical protein [Woeseiaceae bacterium]